MTYNLKVNLIPKPKTLRAHHIGIPVANVKAEAEQASNIPPATPPASSHRLPELSRG